jgi:1-acyl-sn-glycerol-3-phosphate acyltransferase
VSRPGRAILTVPLVAALEVAILATAPFTLAVGGLVTLATRSSRPMRSVALVIAYAWIELWALQQIRAGVTDWNALLRQILGRAYEALNRTLDITVSLEEGSPTGEDLADRGGLVVLARHCGPGDTVFIVWLLTVYYLLDPRIVLKDALRWEPTLDLAGRHLPFRFIKRQGSTAVEAVGALAAEMGPGECLLLFPEGGNFTWARWQHAIDRLVVAGEHARARIARRRTHTLPARPGGALAALAGAPGADVLLLAHSGLSDDGRDRPWWRVPVHQELVIRTVLIPAARVPRDPDGAKAFLDNAWAQVDTWVEGHANLLELGTPD